MAGDATSLVRGFADLALADRPQVGGKCASLGELTTAGIPVPPGFAVTTNAFERFVAESAGRVGVRSRIAALDPDDDERIATVSREMREAIVELPVPAQVEDSIAGAYEALARDHGESVAVRSSATCEDSEDASFAGLQDTYLWVNGADRVVDSVRACWASLYNAESIAYRLRLDLAEEQLAMAVAVQVMVDAQCAGVMFTRSPTTGDPSVIVVEGSWGLGSCLVSGEVTPDHFVINKVTGEINSRRTSSKLVRHVRHGDGHGIVEEPVEETLQRVACLSDDDLAELWTLARRTEEHYGSAQDIEWAIARARDDQPGAIYLLQSRPETSWSGREKQPVARTMPKPFDHVLNVMSHRKG